MPLLKLSHFYRAVIRSNQLKVCYLQAFRLLMPVAFVHCV